MSRRLLLSAEVRLAAWVAAMLSHPPHVGAVGALSQTLVRRDAAPAPAGGGDPLSCTVEVLRRLPHASEPFTQGLEFTAAGQLVESSGDFPQGVGSFVRLADPRTGRETRRTSDGLRDTSGSARSYFVTSDGLSTSGSARSYFVEGITEMNGHWFASTYTDRVVLEYDENFGYLRSHPFPYEGWGLTHSADGRSLLATNGTEYLMTVDPATFQVVSARAVTCLGKRVQGLNELEMVPDFLGRGPAVVGNVINTRLALALDPATARCSAVFHLAGGGLERERESERWGHHVANGIAHDRRRGTFFVTGKNWRSLFEVRIGAEPGQTSALSVLGQHLSSAAPSPL